MDSLRRFARFTQCSFACILLLSASSLHAQQPVAGHSLEQLEEAYAQDLREKVDVAYTAGLQKLNDAYRAALDAALKRVIAAGSLDDAVAIKAEITRFAADATVPPDDASTPPQADVTKLRQAWRAESDRLERRRSTAARPLTLAHLERLKALEIELTRASKIEEAQAVREKRTMLAKTVEQAPQPAATAPTAGAPVAAVPPAAGVRKPLAIIPTARPVDRADLYASGNNHCNIRVNGKELVQAMRDKAVKERVNLREGTIITVQIADRFSDNSFWLSAISPNGEFLFETSERWMSYVPADVDKWWVIKGAKEEKPSTPAVEGDEYIGLVKKSASTTPLYQGAQPIHATIEAVKRGSFLYYVVTKEDLVPKPRKP